jgi:hypothetical protein
VAKKEFAVVGRIIGVLFKVLVGIVFSAITILALSTLPASFNQNISLGQSSASMAGLVTSLIVGIFVLIIISTAPSIRQAFGRSFLILGLVVLTLPLSVLVLSSRVSSEIINRALEAAKGATAIGALLASGIMTGVTGFVILFLGAIFIILGFALLLGRRRKESVGNEPPHQEPPHQEPHF